MQVSHVAPQPLSMMIPALPHSLTRHWIHSHSRLNFGVMHEVAWWDSKVIIPDIDKYHSVWKYKQPLDTNIDMKKKYVYFRA